ncbi:MULTISPECIES: hemolysin family protein [Spirulina sp. CCY15215]|uniref:hemolysin family protein n=1 Tax=Spirulina sp. CCY15215 TaxID=2767591 RepID=UPI001EF16DD6|nr:hemolysin family protein [Spirulina major]
MEITVEEAAGILRQDLWLKLLSVLLLIVINAFFVTAEFSMVAVRRSRINQLVEEGDVPARTVQALQRQIERLLSTTQIGITLSSLALGWIGESNASLIVRGILLHLPLPEETTLTIAHSFSVPLAFFGVAYLQIVLGELCPKSLALLYSERLARLLGPPSWAIARIFNPFILTLNHSTRLLLRLVGVQYLGQGWYTRVTPEELQLIITTERESTGLEAEERELLKNVFEFGEVLAREVMIPRTSLMSLNRAATFAELVDLVAETGHSRYPITGESLDDIVGIIDFKTLSVPLAEDRLEKDTPIAPWVKPARFIPETTFLGDLLPLMQRSHLAMAIVVDEFGGTAGLITLKDLIAEIIGEEPENLGEEEPDYQILNDRTFLVQAQMDLEEVNEELGFNFPLNQEYNTLSGFLLYHFQKIPIQGEMLTYENLDLTIISAEGPRLNQIQIYCHEDINPPVLEENSKDNAYWENAAIGFEEEEK